MRTFIYLAALLSLTGCPGTEIPNFGTFTPNQLDTADTGASGEPFVIEGQTFLYDGEIPGEEEAGVTCPEDDGTCERAFLADGGTVSILYRPEGAQQWTTVEYAPYTAASGSETALVVDLRWNWNSTADAGLPTPWTGYVVISASGSTEHTTLAVFPIDDVE